MNNEVKEKWVTAMKSGEYEFAAGALRAANCFCSLGVLCELYNQENLETSGWVSGSPSQVLLSNKIFGFRAIDEEGLTLTDFGNLPYPVREWAGLTEDQQQTVIELNDHGGTITYDPVVEYLENL